MFYEDTGLGMETRARNLLFKLTALSCISLNRSLNRQRTVSIMKPSFEGISYFLRPRKHLDSWLSSSWIPYLTQVFTLQSFCSGISFLLLLTKIEKVKVQVVIAFGTLENGFLFILTFSLKPSSAESLSIVLHTVDRHIWGAPLTAKSLSTIREFKTRGSSPAQMYFPCCIPVREKSERKTWFSFAFRAQS